MFASDLQNDLLRWVVKQSDVGAQTDYTANRIVILTVRDATDYTTIINGTSFTFTSGSSTTKELIAAGIVAAITAGAEPVTAINVGDGIYTLTADSAAYTLSVDDGQMIGTDRVIWESSNAPRPTRTYLAVSISNIRLVGQAETRIENDGVMLLRNGLELTLTIGAYSAYGPENIDAMILLSELSIATAKQFSLDYFREKKLGFLGVASLTNLNALRGSEFEQRASMDLIFQTAMGVIDNVGWIEKISGTGVFNDTIINNYEISI